MKLSRLKKELLLVIYQDYKIGTKSGDFGFYKVSDLADIIWGDKAFYHSERKGLPVLKNSFSVSLRRSLKRLERDRLIFKDNWQYMGKQYIRYCPTPRGKSIARTLESEIIEWVSLLKKGRVTI